MIQGGAGLFFIIISQSLYIGFSSLGGIKKKIQFNSIIVRKVSGDHTGRIILR